MMNDEAIKTLREDYCGNRIICELYPDQCNREDCEIWLAIKALETQPDGDAVSRKDAIRIVDSIDTWQAGWRGNAIESLKALPSAQPEVAKDTNVPINDTISRQAAIDALYKMLHDCFWADDEELDAVITTLNELPSAQPDLCDGCDRYGASCVGEGCGKLEMPEIIRCKDCKHHRQNNYGDTWCAHPKGLDAFDLMPTDFCSRAERRTDGDRNG